MPAAARTGKFSGTEASTDLYILPYWHRQPEPAVHNLPWLFGGRFLRVSGRMLKSCVWDDRRMHNTSRRARRAKARFLIMVLAGLAAALLTSVLGYWPVAAAVGWCAAALVYNLWVWVTIKGMDAARTSAHAQEEDPRRGTFDLLIVLAALASLAAVLGVMIAAKDEQGLAKLALALLSLFTVALSWLLIHTLFTLRYARTYYSLPHPGGISFNQDDPPQYTDFAYIAFCLGMTYQVSDTDIQTREMRSVALRHSLLAFVFGTGILATTLNLVVSLAQ